MMSGRRVAAFVLCMSALVLAQEPKKPQPEDPPEPPVEHKRPEAKKDEPAKRADGEKQEAEEGPSPYKLEQWAKLGTPGEHHRRLQLLVGKWNLEVTASDASPSKGSAEYEEILGGRFVTEHVKVVLGDQPFEWYGTYGYDNAKQKYTAVWMDNMGTGMDFAEGNNEGDVIQLRGERQETPAERVRYKWIIRVRDRDTVSMEMIDIPDTGKDQPQMTIHMKRAK